MSYRCLTDLKVLPKDTVEIILEFLAPPKLAVTPRDLCSSNLEEFWEDSDAIKFEFSVLYHIKYTIPSIRNVSTVGNVSAAVDSINRTPNRRGRRGHWSYYARNIHKSFNISSTVNIFSMEIK